MRLSQARIAGKASQIEIAFVREVGVAVERDVGDRVVAGGEEVVRREMLLHHAEGLIALLHPVLERVHLQFASALDQREPEERRAEIGLEAVLLEEHPLQRGGAVDAVVRRERRAARDVPEDRVRLGEIASGRDLEHRHAPARIHREEIRRARLALQDVDVDDVVGDAELREREPHLVAIPRPLHRIERVHAVPSRRPAGTDKGVDATIARPACDGPSTKVIHTLPNVTLELFQLRARRGVKHHSAATRCARAYSTSASSPTCSIGVKSRCAMNSGRLNLVMWLETAHSVR